MAIDWQYLRDQIETRMKAAGYNPTSLSREIKAHATYVRDILEGRSKSPGYDKIVAIADKLGWAARHSSRTYRELVRATRPIP